MTEVQFHFNATNRLVYACRLLRKAARLGTGVCVTADTPVLNELDKLLWAFDPQDFVPHARVRGGQPVGAAQQRARVWLAEDAAAGSRHTVLVNLGREPAAGFEAYQRLIEIVSTDADDRDAARLRWKHYAGLGHQIARHEVSA